MNKPSWPVFPALLALALLLLPGAAGAADTAPSPEAVWSRFAESLRRGDYAAAHGLFSAESRRALPYGEFVEEYAPLSPARELVLAPAAHSTSRHEENWAELVFEGAMPATGRAFRVGVSLVRNGGDWGVVAARNEQAERVEALVRRALGRMNGANEAEFAGRAAELAAAEPALRFYRLRLVGGVAVAEPLAAGLRTFHLGPDGVAETVRTAPALPRRQSEPAPVAAQAASSVPPAEAPLTGDLPELSEPPAPRRLPPMPAEPAEPPMRGAGGGADLPDRIN